MSGGQWDSVNEGVGVCRGMVGRGDGDARKRHREGSDDDIQQSSAEIPISALNISNLDFRARSSFSDGPSLGEPREVFAVPDVTVLVRVEAVVARVPLSVRRNKAKSAALTSRE